MNKEKKEKRNWVLLFVGETTVIAGKQRFLKV
jgi:hypothetical protein